jgi:hypothetical protein
MPEPVLAAPGPLPKKEKPPFAALSSCKIPRATTTISAYELDPFGMELRNVEDELQQLTMDLGDLQF